MTILKEETVEATTTRRQHPGGWVNPAKLARGPNGRALCRRCTIEVPMNRRTFCSYACVHEWKLRTNGTYLRQCVFDRDRGVCATCSQDALAGLTGLRVRSRGTGHLWQADHIVPVIEGGGECGLDNLRTLCTVCHKRVTAELAAKLAAKRAADRRTPDTVV